ncbi:MAG: transporter substrate-binding protein [Actinobacteria bacterium]|nr:transporter substrate-binding protein [Actinomycetota bacterium]
MLRKSLNTRLALLFIGAVAIMIAAGCGGSGSTTTTTAASPAASTGSSAAPATTTATPSGEPIKVGSILDETGAINVYGKTMIDATNLAIEDINAKGGVLGRPLQLVSYDAQSTNDKYTQYTNQLILQDKVAVLMGGITSASREAMRPVIDRSHALYFYNEQYEGGVADKLVFLTGVVPEQQLSTLIPWAIKNDGPKMYVIAADYNYGHISADWVKQYADKNGGTVVGQEFIPLEVSDFGATLSKIQEAKPDVIVSLLVGGNHIAFYRQWAAAGLKDKLPVVSATFGLGNEQVVLSPSEAQGIVVAYPYFQELDTPANKDFVALWHAKFGADYPYITDSDNAVWTGWHLWAAAANKAGSVDVDKVIAALESGIDFDSPEGKVSLDPKTHHLVHNVRIAKVNATKGFDILETFDNVAPNVYIDLTQNSTAHTQYTPGGK